MRIRSLSPILAVALALAPRPLLAQPSTPDRDRARLLANEGYDALDRKDYATAIDRFTQADALFHVATVAIGLARAQAGVGHLVDAKRTYERIVSEGAKPGSPPAIAKAVADAQRELAAIAPRVGGLVITV